jgi:hypothetical protein
MSPLSVSQSTLEVRRAEAFGDGDCVIDAELVARLNRKRERDPLAALTEQERRVPVLMAHVRNIFLKLNLHPDPGDHRRVLAVLTFLPS